MQSSGGRTRPSGPVELIPYVERACSELGYLTADVASGMAYVIWAQSHEKNAQSSSGGLAADSGLIAPTNPI